MKKETLGVYTYKHAETLYPVPFYVLFSMRVRIHGETEKSYRVEYMARHENGRPSGSLAWVRKGSVKVDGQSLQYVRGENRNN